MTMAPSTKVCPERPDFWPCIGFSCPAARSTTRRARLAHHENNGNPRYALYSFS